MNALQRFAARILGLAPISQRQYNAAKKVSANTNLHAGVRQRQTQDQVLARDGAMLTAIARKLVRNNLAASSAVDHLARKSVQHGIRPQVRTRNERLNKDIEKAFRRWSKKVNLRKNLSWARLQALWLREIVTAGEAFSHSIILQDGFYIEAFEPEQLSSGLFETIGSTGKGETVSRGIRYDDLGRPVSYYVEKNLPGLEGSLAPFDYDEIAADRVQHIYQITRPSAWRGASHFDSPAIPLDDVDSARYHTLKSIEMAARYGIHVQLPEDVDPLNEMDGLGAKLNEDNELEYNMANGSVNMMQGAASMLASPHPGPQFTPFVDSVLMAVAARMGVPAHAVTGDVSKANYSSLRAAFQEARNTYHEMQDLLIEMGCEPVFELWLRNAVKTGEVLLTENVGIMEVMDSLEWQRPGFPYVDPLKEGQADDLAIARGTKTFDQVCAEQGLDGREQRERIKQAQALDEEIGVKTPTVGSVESVTTEEPAEDDDQQSPEVNTEGAEARATTTIRWKDQ